MRPVGFAPRKKQCELLFLRGQTIVNTIVPFSSREPLSFTVNEMGTFVLLIAVSPSQARVHTAFMIEELLLLFMHHMLRVCICAYVCACVFK